MTRIWDHLLERLSGPLQVRFFIQPAVALSFGIRDGLKDARRGVPAYLWSIYTHPEQRQSLMQEGWKAMAKVFVVALIIDVLYQFLVFGLVYPGEAVLVAVLLAGVPYVIVRGAANRFAGSRLWQRWTHHR